MILAVDFDRTLSDFDNRGSNPLGPPMPDAIEVLRRLRGRGHRIIIHTCRAATPSGAAMVKRWCAQHHLPHDGITAVKPVADAYIDDRAIRFTNWADLFAQFTLPARRGPDTKEG